MTTFVMQFTIDLDISTRELERWYRGDARVVRARSREGRWLQFPATVLRPFVTRDGIAGTFVVDIDDGRKLRHFSRLPT